MYKRFLSGSNNQPVQPEQKFSRRLGRMLSWFLPSGGTLLLMALLIATQDVWAGAGLRRATAESAASTETIAYQGYLTDSSGSPLTSTLDIGFRLYSASAGGAPLWTEEWNGGNGVEVNDGLFSVMLGSLTPIPQSVITGNSNLFLGITVGTDNEMVPRVQLGSVPFAVQALTVPDGSVGTAKLNVDSALNMDSHALQKAIVWPPSYDGTSSHSALPGFMDTLYYATRRSGFAVEVNRPIDGGSIENMFNLDVDASAHWNDVSPLNPVEITLTYLPGKGSFISGLTLVFGWRDSQAVSYAIDVYADSDDDGLYDWRSIAEVVGNSWNEVYHVLDDWRVRKLKITVTDAPGGTLRISTIQATSAIYGKATGHMLDIGGDTMYGPLDMNFSPVQNVSSLGIEGPIMAGGQTFFSGSDLSDGWLRLPSKSSDPASPVDGIIYYSSSADCLRIYAKGSWRDIACW